MNRPNTYIASVIILANIGLSIGFITQLHQLIEISFWTSATLSVYLIITLIKDDIKSKNLSETVKLP